MIRAVKALQTDTIVQREALRGMAPQDDEHDAALLAELSDTIQTAQNHIDALEHVIQRLSPAEAARV